METYTPYLVEGKDFGTDIDRAIRTLKEEIRRGEMAGGQVTGHVVMLKVPNNAVIIGDLHGDMGSLRQILLDVDFEKFLSDPQNKMIFLGDYVDRGSHSIEVLQYVCYLKHRYPGSVVLMRGNHEAPSEFPFPSHDLPTRMSEQLGKGWEQSYRKVLELFQLLTVVTIIEGRLLLVHGGLPTDVEDSYEKLMGGTKEGLLGNGTLEEVLWNDPRPLKDGMLYEESRRIYGLHFGEGLSKRWLAKTGTRAIVRSHEPCKMFRTDHNNRVMTIFSCSESYPNFEAGYLLTTGSQLWSIHDAHELVQYVQKIKK